MGYSAFHELSRQLKTPKVKESGKLMYKKMMELKEHLGLLNDIELMRFCINHTWRNIILNPSSKIQNPKQR